MGGRDSDTISSQHSHPNPTVLDKNCLPENEGWRVFEAEAAYADSIFRTTIGDSESTIDALRRCLDILPAYAPAILSLGSVEYQLNRPEEGSQLFFSLFDLPDDTEDLHEIIDKAGDYLIEIEAYDTGLQLYRRAVERFPNIAVFHQGKSCCAGHEDLHKEAIAAARAALELEPDNQKFVNDLGWCLHEAQQYNEAQQVLERAVTMSPTDERASNNLRLCIEAQENEHHLQPSQ